MFLDNQPEIVLLSTFGVHCIFSCVMEILARGRWNLSLCFFFKNQIGDGIVTHACFTLFSLVMGNTFLRQVEFELVQFFLKVKLEIVLLGIQMVWTVIFFLCMLEAVELVKIMFNTPGVYSLFSYVILA